MNHYSGLFVILDVSMFIILMTILQCTLTLLTNVMNWLSISVRTNTKLTIIIEGQIVSTINATHLHLFVNLNEMYLNSQEVAQRLPATVGHYLQGAGVLR